MGRVTIYGINRLERTMIRAADLMSDLKEANRSAAATAAAGGRTASPVRTGRLAATVRGNNAAGAAVILAGRARVPYAGPIHWGWAARNITANPFLVRGARATEGVWVQAYANNVQALLNTVRGA